VRNYLLSLLIFLGLFPLALQAKLPPGVAKITDSLSILCAEPLFNYNTEAAYTLLRDALEKNRYLQRLKIIDTITGKTFASVSRDGAETEPLDRFTKTITYRNEKIGTLIIDYSSTLITLTPAERQWIKAHPRIRVGMIAWEPIAIFKEGNKLQGMIGDYLQLISQRTGLKFDTVLLHSWPEIFSKLQKKQIDLIPSLGTDQALTLQGSVSHIYMRFPYVIVSRIKESFLNSLDELNGKSVAVPLHWPSYSYLKNRHPRIHLTPTRDIIQALEWVKENKAFAFVGHMAVSMYYVGNFYSNTLHIAGKTDYIYEHRMAARKEDTLLIDIINKVFASLTPEEHQEIKNRWLHIEVKEAADYTPFYIAGSVFFFLILAFVYWNRKLSAEIEERKKVEAKLAIAKQEAERANSAKSIFLANMSHEIRTPMNAIVGFTELLNDEIKSPKLRSYVQNIQNASHTLLRLINDILDLSKIEAGKLELQAVPTDLAALARELGGVFELNARRKGIRLIIDPDPMLPDAVMIDEVRLRQILLNLLGNAVKFTEKGSVTLTIRYRISPGDPQSIDLTISVKDTGIGIPQDQQEKIFEAFEQTQGQDSRKYGGTGLGLSISKRLCEMMGGRITLESTPGKGSTFTLTLPKVPLSERPDTRPSFARLRAEGFREGTLLIADDVADNRELLIKIFENSPLHVVVAKDGLEAVELFRHHRPDLVLMDLRMPRMDGYEAAKKIKEESPDTPVIALTASIHRRSELPPDLFDAILGKPLNRQLLFETLRRFLPYFEENGQSHNSEPSPLISWSDEARTRFLHADPSDKEQLLYHYKQAIHSNSIEDIRKFANLLRQMGERYSLPPFEELAAKLQLALESFDISEMERSLRLFNEIVPRANPSQPHSKGKEHSS